MHPSFQPVRGQEKLDENFIRSPLRVLVTSVKNKRFTGRQSISARAVPGLRTGISMLARFVFHSSVVLASSVVGGAITARLKPFPIPEDEAALEFVVGYFNNDCAASQQFGYLSKIQGLNTVSCDIPESETTALFSFVTNTTIRGVAQRYRRYGLGARTRYLHANNSRLVVESRRVGGFSRGGST